MRPRSSSAGGYARKVRCPCGQTSLTGQAAELVTKVFAKTSCVHCGARLAFNPKKGDGRAPVVFLPVE